MSIHEHVCFHIPYKLKGMKFYRQWRSYISYLIAERIKALWCARQAIYIPCLISSLYFQEQSIGFNGLISNDILFIVTGQHYFYKTQPKMACEDLSQSFFPLYEKGHLVGFGAVGFGKGSDGPTRTWYEKPPGVAVKVSHKSLRACLSSS